MRLVGLLLLHLYVFLPGGQGYARTSTHDYQTCYSQVQRTLQALDPGPKQDRQLIKDDGSPGEDTYLVLVDDDDNEEDIVRKPVFQARELLAFLCTCILYHQYSSRAENLSFCEPPSSIGAPKYIVQRVLRI